jgi:primase-polymerase (primpol)-like protein
MGLLAPELCDGRRATPCYQPNRRKASHSDPLTWNTFDGCCAAALENPRFFDGIGYAFSTGDPYFRIDIDAIYRSDTAEAPPGRRHYCRIPGSRLRRRLA